MPTNHVLTQHGAASEQFALERLSSGSLEESSRKYGGHSLRKPITRFDPRVCGTYFPLLGSSQNLQLSPITVYVGTSTSALRNDNEN